MTPGLTAFQMGRPVDLLAKNCAPYVLIIESVRRQRVYAIFLMVHILIATTNAGKIRELARLLGELNVKVMGIGNQVTTEEIETGSTFAENALLKARYFHSLSGLPTVADDSGLEVSAIGGAPGIYSARYGGVGAFDSDRVTKLLTELEGVPPESRCARFVCAAAIVWKDGERVFTDEARGMILESPRGEGGFGYDPVFYFEPLGRTFAELTLSEKSEVSHRGKAFRKLGKWLEQSGLLDTANPDDKIDSLTGETSASP